MREKFQASVVRQLDHGFIVVELLGPITADAGNTFQLLSHNLKTMPAREIVLDFTKVDKLDGSGLKQLLIFFTLLRKLNKKVSAYGLNPDVDQIFGVTHLSSLVRTFGSESQALADIG